MYGLGKPIMACTRLRPVSRSFQKRDPTENWLAIILWMPVQERLQRLSWLTGLTWHGFNDFGFSCKVFFLFFTALFPRITQVEGVHARSEFWCGCDDEDTAPKRPNLPHLRSCGCGTDPPMCIWPSCVRETLWAAQKSPGLDGNCGAETRLHLPCYCRCRVVSDLGYC